MATIDEIKQQAEAVKNASHVGENTALRVGGVLVDLCEWMKKLSDNAGNGGGGTSGGSGVSLGTLLTKLNTDNPFPTDNGQVLTYNGSNFIWKTPTGSGVTLSPVMDAMNRGLTKTSYGTPQFLYWDGSKYTWKNESEISGSGGSIQVAQTPEYAGGSENWVSTTKLRFVGITGTKPTIRTNSEKSCVDVGIPVGGGSGSSGTTAGKLRFYQDSSEETWNGESDFKIIFGSGLNVTWDSHSQITLSATGGSSGGSSGGSVSWENVTNKPSTFTPSSHTHSTSEISGLDSYVKGTKVSNAGTADRLSNAVTLWGNSFSGNNSIGTTSSYADLRYVKNIYAGSTFDIEANNKSVLRTIGTDIHIGFGYMSNANTSLILFGNKTKICTNGDDYNYEFKNDVFDVNTNTIHFGYTTSGGKISWDAANNAFKIEGNVYATGGITALGVSNSATTSNNVDFTFKSVTANSITANTFNVKNSIQLSDSLKLNRSGKDVYLANTGTNGHYIYLDGSGGNYYLSSDGDATFNTLECVVFNISGTSNFEITEISGTSFNMQFDYGGKTYIFTPPKDSIRVI